MGTLQGDILDILESLCVTDRPPVDEVLLLQPLPRHVELKRAGRRCSQILFDHATSVIVRVKKMQFSLLIPAGWKTFNLPDGAELSLEEGQEPLSIIHRVSDMPFFCND